MSAPIAVFILLPIILVYILYAGVIRKKNQVLEALSGIDVQLTKRYDLIPEALAIAKRYMQHEQNLLTELIELRNAASQHVKDAQVDELPQSFSQANALGKGMTRLFALAENYPDLKADKLMARAMDLYHDIELDLAAARRFYNSAVKELNNATEIFPSSTVAKMIGIKAYPFFQAEAQARDKISAADALK